MERRHMHFTQQPDICYCSHQIVNAIHAFIESFGFYTVATKAVYTVVCIPNLAEMVKNMQVFLIKAANSLMPSQPKLILAFKSHGKY